MLQHTWCQMIRFSKFTFVHVPRTGGLWITDVLKRHFPVETEYHPHMMPFAQINHPIIAVVRNPHDWWESWIAWGRYYPDKDPYYSAVMERGDSRTVDQIVADYKLRFGEILNGTPLPFIARMAAWQVGPLTARIRDLNRCDVRWVEFESLRESWISALESVGVMTDELRADILTTPVYNESPAGVKERLTVDISELEPCHGR